MQLGFFDVFAFVGFIAVVVGVSLYASRKQESSEDYFLAGRGLTWWLIGFSLIASNISTEHFVGMAGEGYGLGLAIASYEWIAAITLVFVALVLLPGFLRSGIYTIPEYLEHRFSPAARSIMAFYMMAAYVIVAIAAVLYSGALALNTIFDVPSLLAGHLGIDYARATPEELQYLDTVSLIAGVWLIGLLAGAYTVYGGLKAVVWSDLLQGSALLIGAVIVTVLGFKAVGGVDAFLAHSGDKLHTLLPADHPKMPWTIMLGGIWIPNIFYWGLNQFITQRTLGAKSLAEGQKGILLAAGIKLLIPFIIVFPGIMAFELYGSEIANGDQAYPYMIHKILPVGLRGIMLAALFGAVMSSLDSMLNSAATIFTIDLYKRHLRPEADPHRLIKIGRLATGLFVVVGCLWAPFLARFGGVFEYIQMVWGFISPGIVAVFLFGLVIKKAPPLAAVGALLLTVPVYGLCLWIMPGAFLNAMGVTVLVLWVFMGAVTYARPLSKPVTLPVNEDIDMTATPVAKIWGALTVVVTIVLYVIFR